MYVYRYMMRETKTTMVWPSERRPQAPGNTKGRTTGKEQKSMERCSKSGDGSTRPGIKQKIKMYTD